ncbi:hypothetical protein RJ641_009522 [Dillenia turbinata]|uniref:Uncharacterized protein n=1 Tax=Dillenia turbinata TaxID=194707 RepID=A0AAN8V7X1_9MAGN
MATTPFLPDQQQTQEAVPNIPEAVSSSAWKNSGSIGPFFAVISVLGILAVLSCFVGRALAGRAEANPLVSIKHRGCLLWVKLKWRHNCIGGDPEAGGGAKTVASEEGK